MGACGSKEESAIAAPEPEMSNPVPPQMRSARRRSVSAECGPPPTEFKRTVIEKSPEVTARIKDAMEKDNKSGWFFTSLDEEQLSDVIGAMSERKPEAGEVLITQGEEGDNFYLIEGGRFEAIVNDKVVFTYEGKGSFGELALMYNCPRAATVKCIESGGTVFALDRANFRGIVVGAMANKTKAYEGFLESAQLFKDLDSYQRSTIADCLIPETVEDGVTIMKQGDEIDADAKFYIVEKGCVECYRAGTLVKTVGPGEFFGELALVEKAPRAADCIAKGKTKLLSMGREAFERLMGPAEELLQEAIQEYKKVNNTSI